MGVPVRETLGGLGKLGKRYDARRNSVLFFSLLLSQLVGPLLSTLNLHAGIL
jgi:hypothetical protein